MTALDAWAAGVTLEDFIALVASEPALRDLFDAYGLYDLLVALIPPASVPWEQLDLTVSGIQNAGRAARRPVLVLRRHHSLRPSRHRNA